MIDAVVAVGDVGSPHTWSGIPWYFQRTAREAGHPAAPWRLSMRSFVWPRRFWNLRQVLHGQGHGGYQYSTDFLERAERSIPDELWQGRILTFNQHLPRTKSVATRGGRLVHYLDATFASLCAPGGIEAPQPETVKTRALAVEKENLLGSERVVTMARWAAESVATDCGVPAAKVAIILPGANLDLPVSYDFPLAPGRPGRDRPLVLGFIGKDWRRKGLPFLLTVQQQLARSGWLVLVRCAGHAPRELTKMPGVEYTGFIDKAREPERFLAFLAGCDLGCLFSSHEPLGISTLEFLRAGVPVAGFTVEGLADTLPSDAGFRFSPATPAAEVAHAIATAFEDEGRAESLRAAAQAWSPLVTWERCVAEWAELLDTGRIARPVQPWAGLPKP